MSAQSLFLFMSPREILDKAKQDFAVLQTQITAHTIFNFCVTVYHVRDYVLSSYPNLKPDVLQLQQDVDLKVCHYICNRGKHAVKPRDPQGVSHFLHGGMPGLLIPGRSRLAQPPELVVLVDGQEVEFDIQSIGNRVLALWDQFFQRHSIS